MATLLVGYDLNKPGQNYDDLWVHLKDLGPWWHYLDSTWLTLSGACLCHAKRVMGCARQLQAPLALRWR